MCMRRVICQHSAQLYKTALLHLQTFGLQVGKATTVYETNTRERSEYDTRLNDTQAQIESLRREIDALKQQLQEERQWRRQEEEYEALAHIINSYPARKLTEAYVASVGNWELLFTVQSVALAHFYSP